MAVEEKRGGEIKSKIMIMSKSEYFGLMPFEKRESAKSETRTEMCKGANREVEQTSFWYLRETCVFVNAGAILR